MIGSHDTFTYLEPKLGIFLPFKRLWRTQELSIFEQYDFGVRFFDIRVVRYRKEWIFAHGLAYFDGYSFKTISAICYWMTKYFKDAIFRIVLERGSSKTEQLFKNEVAETDCVNLWMADIKHNRIWRGQVLNHSSELYERGYKFARTSCTWVEPCYEKHGDVRNLWKVNLKEDALAINKSLGMDGPMTLEGMKESKDELYFIDYCNL